MLSALKSYCPNFIMTTFILCLVSPSSVVFANQISSPPISEKNTSIPAGNQVFFSISESQTLDNDISIITLKAIAQDRTAQAVIDEINQKMHSAIALLKKYSDISSQTRQYQVHPIYNKGKTIRHWQGSQSLAITFNLDLKPLNVLSELQEKLVYQSMQFKVSEERYKKALTALTLKALQSFQQQAGLIAQSFNASNYQITETRINTPQYRTNYQKYTITSRIMAADSMAPPAMEAGTSTLKVDISGQLLLSE